MKRVCAYGKNLGRAFQIADDIADYPLDKAALCKMRRKVKFFISKAKKEIAGLGKRAEVLDYIADRINAKAN